MPALSLLLKTCLSSLWSPLFPLHAPALIPLFLVKVHLSLTLTLFPLTIWYSGQTALFLFLFGKGGSGVLVNCFLCNAKATFSFSAGTVCLSFSSRACAILHAFCWSLHHQQVCHFSSPLSFLLSQSLWQIWQEMSSLSACSVRLQ